MDPNATLTTTLSATLRSTVSLLREEADTAIRRRLAAALVLVLAGSTLAACAPLALKAVVDALAAPARPEGVVPSVLLLGSAYLLALALGRALADVRPLLTGAAEQRLHARLSRRFLAHLMALPMSFHAERASGALVQSLAQAAVGCQLMLSTLVSALAPVLAELLMVLAVLVHLDQGALVASFAVTAVAYLVVSAVAALQVQARARHVTQASMQAHACLADTLLNVEPIKCLGAEPAMAMRYASSTAALEASWVGLYRHRAGTGLALTATFTLSMAASLTIAVHAFERGSLSLGGFVLVTVYLLQLVRPLETLGAAARDLAQALAFVRPVLEVLQLPPEASGPSLYPQAVGTQTNTSARDRTAAAASTTRPFDPVAGPMARPSNGPMTLSLRGLHLAYGQAAPVLKGLDLDIAAGSTVGVVGASGAGKTSLVRLLLRLYAPQAGQILVDGNPIDALPLAEHRAAIGFVPQDTVLINASMADNIAMGRLYATPAAIEVAARQAHLHHFILSLPQGYDTQVGERGLKLSGGERQRVAIARVALRRPRLLLLDEATSMLDAHTEARVLQSLKQLGQHSTTLIIAHRLRVVAHADEVVVLGDGRVLERGSPAALRAAGGLYARLWLAQMGREAAPPPPAPVPSRPAGLH